MRIGLQAFIVALLVAATLVPLVRRLAIRVGAVAHPGGRNVHRHVTPRLGGLAIFGGFVVGLSTALYFASPAIWQPLDAVTVRVVGVLVGGGAICAVGAVDDVRNIRARDKLALQTIVAVIAFSCGLRINAVHIPLVGDVDTAVLALPLTVIWFVAIMNTVNLIDGLDGLAAGIVLLATGPSFVVASLSEDALVLIVSAATAGATLGFLGHNYHPARIFMGDSGSYFLGYVVAATALLAPRGDSAAVPLFVSMTALAVPILDTACSIARRKFQGRSVFAPDRGHIHHALLDARYTPPRAVLILYLVSASLSLAAASLALERPWLVLVSLLGAGAAVMALAHVAGYLRAVQTLLSRRLAEPPRVDVFATRQTSVSIDPLPLRQPDLPVGVEVAGSAHPAQTEHGFGNVERPADPM
jgi:UDP-GlcNAc:undecaprenyl-phosphate/decaprenyl-phosphate GlcNAc-1-phosphate transferase